MEEIAPIIEEEWIKRVKSETTGDIWVNKDKWTKILKKEMRKLKWKVSLFMRCFTSYQKEENIAKKFKKIVLLYVYLHSASLDEKKKFVESSVKSMPIRIVEMIKGEFISYGDYYVKPEDFTIIKTCIIKSLERGRHKMGNIAG